MDKGRNWSKSLLTLVVPLALLFAAACAEIRVNTIPAPPPAAKLRVCIQVLTSSENVYWQVPHIVHEQNTIRGTAKMLQEKGIYEIVPQDDVKSALGGRQVLMRSDWSRKDWALAKQVGRAVHAEYVLFLERSQYVGMVHHEMILINTKTEKKFRVLASMPSRIHIPVKEYQKLFNISYRKLFLSAKEDMLATAIRKGRLEKAETSGQMASQPDLPSGLVAPRETRPSPSVPSVPSSPIEKPVVVGKPKVPQLSSAPVPPHTTSAATTETRPSPSVLHVPSSPKEKPVVVSKPVAPKSSPPPVLPLSGADESTLAKASPPQISFPPSPGPPASFTAESRVDLEKAFQAETRVEGRRQLAVYDLDAVTQYKIVALILSEALREELFKLGFFKLVNRENIVKVLEEMALQQTGLLDEKEAVKAGKGLAVQQIVLGQYGTVGRIAILQVKRLDVETQGALGVGSLKCDVGREEELLQHMGDLAKKISGKK